MKKSKSKTRVKNPVAKFFNDFNKPSVERDRKKYHRPSNKKALKSEGFSFGKKC